MLRFDSWFSGFGSIGCPKVPGCLDSLSGSLDMVLWLPVVNVPGYMDSIPGSLDLVPSLPGEGPCCLELVAGSLDMVPSLLGEGSLFPGFGCWFPRLKSLVSWLRSLVAGIHFLIPWTLPNGCLVKVSWLPGFGFCFPVFG